ncbi:DUF58 domain-containing protein [Cellulosimicrobium arenosum]|uniref:DUF58 domain-containing protein n=1 Tax=Cellulosimicrobium arenosum TaxID=2708133 RepID=A0A927G6H2_9MICO|nr:DUF58 domain-containing protein [Cellulosimicrobium arenosum]MBD8077804.1 DUF58 domain-containing protein [Cellulosimicrobium arenosum]
MTSLGTAGTQAPVWRTTTTFASGVVLGVLLLGTGLVAGRADVALLGVPAILSAAWGWAHRPVGTVTAGIRLDPDAPLGVLGATLRLDAPPGAEIVRFRVLGPSRLETERVVATTSGERELALRMPSARTGVEDTFRVDHVAYGPEGVEEQGPVVTTGPRRLVLPQPVPLRRVPLASRLRGLSGPHTSRRPGDGTELRDVDTYRPGDSTRRIDWRTTARRSPGLDALSVRRTFATAEATVVLVVDSRDEVGPDLATWGGVGSQRPDEPTSLDLARHAAASVAQAVLDGGDRVALDDLGRVRRPVRPGAGRRHLRRVLHALALARPAGDPTARHRPPQVPAGAAVYLFSTLLDDEAPRLAREWHRAGYVVVVVDTLPPVTVAAAYDRVVLAWRITRLEREDRVDTLRAEGIEVVRWYTPADAGTTGGGGTAARGAFEVAAARHERRAGRGGAAPREGAR